MVLVMTMKGYIILRDIPKEYVQLDTLGFEIQGGFRGFAHVEPGIHYVSVKVNEEMHEGFWCFVNADDAVIKQYDYLKDEFHDCTPEDERNYKELATSGAMNRYLIPIMPYNFKACAYWNLMTSYLKENKFPFKLNNEEPMHPPEDLNAEELNNWYTTTFKSRFEQAFFGSHNGVVDDFLAELQFSFVSYLVKPSNEIALNRWSHLLQASYNAGERCINNTPKLFEEFVEIIRIQFDNFDDEKFEKDNKLVNGAANLIEDMIDTEIETLVEKANSFRDYLIERGIDN
ncbi:MAG: AAR2 pre-mRNA splicing protein [Asgard group archaeon]|nr:AAR2 pre-mRNA splicing protein [Asgard group archaeon]